MVDYTTERVSQRCQTKAKKAVKGETRNNERTLAAIYFKQATHHAAALRLHPSAAPPPYTSAHR